MRSSRELLGKGEGHKKPGGAVDGDAEERFSVKSNCV